MCLIAFKYNTYHALVPLNVSLLHKAWIVLYNHRWSFCPSIHGLHLPATAQEGGGVKQPSVGKRHCLHLPATAQEGRGQIGSAPPPHKRWSLLHGGWEVEQGCFLVGNNYPTSPNTFPVYITHSVITYQSW